ncbi:pyridoxal phosphate-dependent transferase [Zopfochytrium polystomum]|nr:pyridoxal phosphate-dependent transferase [Zopfochytrium polystomum]
MSRLLPAARSFFASAATASSAPRRRLLLSVNAASAVRSFGSTSARRFPITHPDPDPAADPVLAANLAKDSHIIQFYPQPQFYFVRGQGAYLIDSADRAFLDMMSGIAVNALGHNDPDVVAAVSDQASRLIHISQYYKNLHAGPLATKLVNLASAGNDRMQKHGAKVFFGNSGTEANEGAIKFARKYAKHVAKDYGVEPEDKFGVVSFGAGFHGRTFATMSATPNPVYQAPFAPLVPGFTHVPYNNIEKMREAVTATTAAVILEPIQGEGGIVGAVMIMDEVQAGGSRTGKFFAHQHFGVSPDIVTFAKPLANGIPTSAVITSGHIASLLKPGDHGNTFGFNPLAARVGNVVVDKLSAPSFLKHVEEIGAYFKEELESKVVDGKVVTGVRGMGLMLAMKFSEKANLYKFVELCRYRGVLVITSGDHTIRLVPPLIIGKKEVDLAVAAFQEVISEMAKDL